MIRHDPTLRGPLHGIRVIDLSRLVAGNMMSLQLGDFGADVIKVEPLQGDPLRDWRDGGQSLHWKTYGRNKRSIALNLRQDRDMAVLHRLLETADVFIENFRPGTLEEMGLGPDMLARLNPRLITVRISGFGQTGPYAMLPGFGTLVEAMSGYAARTGFPDREPVLPPLALADMIAGITGANAAMMALFARERGDVQGQVIDLSLLEPIFAMLGPEAAIHRTTGKVKERSGSASNTVSPRNVYCCADGRYLALSGSTQAVALRIFDVIGQPGMKTDPRFSTNAARVVHRDLVDQSIAAWFAQRDRDAALAAMRAAGATVGPVYDIADIAADPHFAERGVIVEVEDPDHGSLPQHNVFPRLSQTAGGFRRPAPQVGQHTDEILAEIGMTRGPS
ncbi:CaiB/BaiF CoA-transferase family protein [Paracoccus nototheniae]|uniref:CaiB/BaiF CoA transferase family protein n=1 Tax=Paracoccus nototheniae TaxID=2489002 RepID=A0ABW4DTS4_9RHOB|nr:CoA transferase [Paracoccus nototheniae]